MHIKRITALLLSLTLLLALAGCGAKGESTDAFTESNNSTTVNPPSSSNNPSSTTPTLPSSSVIPTRPSNSTERETKEIVPLPDYPFEPVVTGIYISRDGVIRSAEVTSFDGPYYDEAELKTFVEDEIAAYNEAKGEDGVSLYSLKVENGKACLILQYKQFSYFKDFQGNEFNIQSLKIVTTEDAAKNYTLTGLVTPEGNSVSPLKALQDEDVKVIAFVGNSSITVNGDILFLSEEFTVTGTNSARIQTTEERYIFFK